MVLQATIICLILGASADDKLQAYQAQPLLFILLILYVDQWVVRTLLSLFQLLTMNTFQVRLEKIHTGT